MGYRRKTADCRVCGRRCDDWLLLPEARDWTPFCQRHVGSEFDRVCALLKEQLRVLLRARGQSDPQVRVMGDTVATSGGTIYRLVALPDDGGDTYVAAAFTHVYGSLGPPRRTSDADVRHGQSDLMHPAQAFRIGDLSEDGPQ